MIMLASKTRDLSINLRISQNQRDLIDRTATLQGKSRSEFMLDSAYQKAQDVLLDRCLFDVDEQRFQQFLDRLDAPVMPNKNLRQLLTAKAPWDQSVMSELEQIPNRPEKFNVSHQVEQFNCGNIQLNDWLKHRAFKNELHRLDLQDALEAIAEAERLGEQPIPSESVAGELV
jgi:uncharacterized protein (DUF1778 family)